jgi:hypothetical protein
MIFVPLPRRVGPTAKPPFWRSRKSHPRTLLPGSASLAGADAAPAASAPLPASCCAPTAGNRRWQVWYGGYVSGTSRHCAPVPRTQSTPFSTARVSCHGRPRLSARRDGHYSARSILSSYRSPESCGQGRHRGLFLLFDDHPAVPGRITSIKYIYIEPRLFLAALDRNHAAHHPAPHRFTAPQFLPTSATLQDRQASGCIRRLPPTAPGSQPDAP